MTKEEIYTLNNIYLRRLQDAMGEVANPQLLQSVLERTELASDGKLAYDKSPNAHMTYIELMKACQELMALLYSVVK